MSIAETASAPKAASTSSPPNPGLLIRDLDCRVRGPRRDDLGLRWIAVSARAPALRSTFPMLRGQGRTPRSPFSSAAISAPSWAMTATTTVRVPSLLPG